MPDDVAVGIDDAAVRQNAADHVAVGIPDKAVFAHIAQKRSVRTVHGTPDELVGNNRALHADRIAVRVNQFAVCADVSDNFSVRPQNSFADGNDLADNLAFKIDNPSVDVRFSDHPTRSVHDAAVGHKDAQYFSVRADDLAHADEYPADNLSVAVNDATVGKLQLAQIAAAHVQSRRIGQNASDQIAVFYVEHVCGNGQDTADDLLFFVLDVSRCGDFTDRFRSRDVLRDADRVAASF